MIIIFKKCKSIINISIIKLIFSRNIYLIKDKDIYKFDISYDI